MGCASSKPVDNNTAPPRPAYSPLQNQNQQQTMYPTILTPSGLSSSTANGVPTTNATTNPTPVPRQTAAAPSQPGVHDAVRRAVTSPDEAYFQIEEKIANGTARVTAVDADHRTALHVAASLGLDSIVEMLLDKGAQVDARDSQGDTPLHVAAKHSKIDVIKSLITSGRAPVNASNNAHLTPLVLAINEGVDPDVVRTLLEHGADPNVSIMNNNGGTALLLLASTPGMEACLMEAVRQGADLSVRDNQGNTVAHVAARRNGVSIIEFVLHSNASLVTAKNANGETPADCALRGGHTEAAALTLEWSFKQAGLSGDAAGVISAVRSGAADMSSAVDGADNTVLHLFAERGYSTALESLSSAMPEHMEVVLIQQNANGMNPLHVAAARGNAAVVRSLMGRRSSSEAAVQMNAEGLAAVHLACQNGDAASVHELISEYPSLVLLQDESTGNSPLHFAAQAGHLATVELLLARGADVNARNGFMQTPLHLAASWNEVSVVHRLLECGADPEAADESALTPLELAQSQDHFDLYQAMIGSSLRRAAAQGDATAIQRAIHTGVSFENLVEDSTGDTVFHVAAKSGQVEVLTTLLECGDSGLIIPSLTLFNEMGDTPIHAAARAGEARAIEVLLCAPGADPNQSNNDGESPLHVAVAEGWIPVVEALVHGGADPDCRSTTRGVTPLQDAACNCINSAVVVTLLHLGADPNAVDDFYGNTALHTLALWGAAGGSAPVAALLMNAGADAEKRNFDGKTAREVAEAGEQSSMVDALPLPLNVQVDGVSSSSVVHNSSSLGSLVSSTSTSVVLSIVATPSAPEAPPPPPSVVDQHNTSTVAAAVTNDTSTTTSVPQTSPAVLYPTVFAAATEDGSNSVPPEVPRTSTTATTTNIFVPPQAVVEFPPCVPLQAVRNQAAVVPVPTSPFAVAAAAAAAAAPPPLTTTPSSPPLTATTPSPYIYPLDHLNPPPMTTSPNTSTGTPATRVLDDRLLIPHNQLHYDRQTKLGQGSFGKVYRGTWLGSKVAIKVPTAENGQGIEMTGLPQRVLDDFRRELHVMAGLRHDNIQDLRGLCFTPEGPAIVSKYYARGSMANVLQQGLRSAECCAELTWKRRLQMALDVAAGMLYMHSQSPPVIHRDLKAVNCFIDEHWKALVGDFGLTKQMHDQAISTSTSSAATNPRWMAPELMADSDNMGESVYTTKTDVYAFGMVLYETLTWKAPFAVDGRGWEIVNKVARGERPSLPKRLPCAPGEDAFAGLPEFLELMKKCWAQDPAERPEFEQIHAQLEVMIAKYGLPSVPTSAPSASAVGAGGGGGGGVVGTERSPQSVARLGVAAAVGN